MSAVETLVDGLYGLLDVIGLTPEDDGFCRCEVPFVDGADENYCWRCKRDIEDEPE